MKRSLSRSPGRIFYGWWIVTIGCVLDAVKGGTFNTGFTVNRAGFPGELIA